MMRRESWPKVSRTSVRQYVYVSFEGTSCSLVPTIAHGKNLTKITLPRGDCPIYCFVSLCFMPISCVPRALQNSDNELLQGMCYTGKLSVVLIHSDTLLRPIPHTHSRKNSFSCPRSLYYSTLLSQLQSLLFSQHFPRPFRCSLNIFSLLSPLDSLFFHRPILFPLTSSSLLAPPTF